jgi:hypothetical protein
MFITMTLPPSGRSFLIASKAARPPPSLSLAIWDTAYDGSSVVVSTRTTLIPAAAACWSGCCMALTSVGATSSASGLAATIESRIGFCRVGSNFCGPWVETLTPSFAASSWAPHCIVM